MTRFPTPAHLVSWARLCPRTIHSGPKPSASSAEKIEKAAFTRADLVELVGAQLPVDTERSPREVETAVDEIGMRLTGPRVAHQREGHERFTLDRILAEEAVLLDLVDARDVRAQLWIKEQDTAGLSADQKRAVENIAASPWLVCAHRQRLQIALARAVACLDPWNHSSGSSWL